LQKNGSGILFELGLRSKSDMGQKIPVGKPVICADA